MTGATLEVVFQLQLGIGRGGRRGGGGRPRSNLQGLVGLGREEKWAKEVAAK